MLSGSAVHHDTDARLELPGALARRDHDRGAAEPVHASLEGSERAQRRVEEDEAENTSFERARLRSLLQSAREREQIEYLLAVEIGQIDEAQHGL